MSVRKWTVVGIVSSVMLALVGCGSSSATAGSSTPYKLGVLDGLTGGASVLAASITDGMTLAVNAVNGAGGVNGHPLSLDIVDDQSQPSNDVTLVRKLIDSGANGIIGPNYGSGTIAVSPIVKKAKVPELAYNQTIGITQQGNPYIFRVQTNDTVNTKAALLFMKQKFGATKVAVLYTDDAYGTSGSKALQSEAGSVGVQIVADESMSVTATDATPQWVHALAAHPQAVLLWVEPAVDGPALRAAAQLDVKLPMIGGSGFANPSAIAAVGPAAEGVYGIGLVDPSNPPVGAKQLVALLRQEHGSSFQVSFLEATGWDAVQLFAEGLRRANGDRNKLLGALESIANYNGAAGTYKYTSTNHDGLGLDAIEILHVQNGKLVGFKHGV